MITHIDAYDTTTFGRFMCSQGDNCTTDYSTLDAFDLSVMSELGRQMAKPPFIDLAPETRREMAEVALSWTRHRAGGRFSFSFGTDVTVRIMKRIWNREIPTAPVPPAYLQFEQAPADYHPGLPLRAAYISRGEVGRITFISDPTDADGGTPMTVLLPSVMRARHTENLETSRRAEMPRPRTKAGGGDAMSRMVDTFRGDVRMRALGRLPGIGYISEYHDALLGAPLPAGGSPELARAAQIVMVAADEARRADAGYGKTVYGDGSMLQRNWLESGEAVAMRSGIVTLP